MSPVAPSDDPTGGRGLSRRLARALPIALAVGLAIGIPVAFAVDDWRPAVAIPLGLAALVGTILGAIEDGRVQRRVDATRTGPSTRSGLRAAAEAARRGDEARVRAEVERALLRGATPRMVAREVDDPRWSEERVAELARALDVSPPPPPGASR